MRDSYHDLSQVSAIAPAAYSADQAGNLIDRLGFESLTFALHIGAGGITFTGTNKIEFVLQHGDAADGSDLANVAASDLIGVTSVTNGIVKALIVAHASADVTKIGYIGNKRFTKLTADFSGTHGTGTPMSALAILSRSTSKPVA